MSSRDKHQKQWEQINSKMERVNAELLALTYGALVSQLSKDLENVESINIQLEKMGYNMGIRMVDEFLAKSNAPPCTDFRNTADVLAKLGLRMFLGITAEVVNWDEEGTSCSLILQENPLDYYVELPNALRQLHYSNLICGIIRGALEQLRMKVKCSFAKDMLKGDDVYEIRLELIELMKEEFLDEDT